MIGHYTTRAGSLTYPSSDLKTFQLLAGQSPVISIHAFRD